jgi:SAM-dependent methyltransferase
MFQPNIKQQIKQQSELGKAIIPFLIKRYNPKSVADFGCGVGEFLRMFAEKAKIKHGYFGVDKYNYRKDVKFNSNHFLNVDLSNDITWISPDLWDITICLEVAEHIPEYRLENFFIFFGFTKKAILFSAATPGQGGKDHVNEQPHEYWHRKFAERGFRTMDIIRPIIRGVVGIPDYYKNNIFVYERI